MGDEQRNRFSWRAKGDVGVKIVTFLGNSRGVAPDSYLEGFPACGRATRNVNHSGNNLDDRPYITDNACVAESFLSPTAHLAEWCEAFGFEYALHNNGSLCSPTPAVAGRLCGSLRN
jgi:hypothetical protein